MARLGDHPQVVTVYDVVEHEGALLIVARYMAGGSLTARLAAAPGHRLPVADAVRIGAELAGALAHAHEHGVVHRDVKPDNIWLTGDGGAALGDFGIALAGDDAPGHGGALTGTPLYMAPEQAYGRGVGPHSDLYALGATLYELVCGRPPFTGDTDTVVEQHLHAPRRAALAPGGGRARRRSTPCSSPSWPRTSGSARRRPRRCATGWAAAGPAAFAVATGRAARRTRGGARPPRGRSSPPQRTASPRVAAITGEAGIGKTRLATAVADGRPPPRRRACCGAAPPSRRPRSPRGGPILHALRDAEQRGRRPRAARGRRGPRAARRRGRGRRGAQGGGPAAAVRRRRTLARARGGGPCRTSSCWRTSTGPTPPRSRSCATWPARSEAARVLVVLTHRAADAAAPLAGAATIALRGLALRRTCAGCSPPGADSAATAAVVHRRTDGNPFFAHELARVLEAEAGGRALLEAVPGQRCARWSGGGSTRCPRPPSAGWRPVRCSVGRSASASWRASWAASPADAADALDEALAAELLVEAAEHPGRHDFPHAIVRDAVYGRLSRRERTRLHAAAADLLRAGAGGDVTAADVAHHSLLAARGGVGADAAWSDALAAAREAEAVLAHAEAVHALRAGPRGERAGRRRAERRGPRSRRSRALAAASLAAGDVEGSRRRRRQAAALARRLGDAAALAEAALGFAHLQPYGEVDHDAIALLQEALDAQAPEDAGVRARLLASLALRTDYVAEQERREALVQEAVALATRQRRRPHGDHRPAHRRHGGVAARARRGPAGRRSTPSCASPPRTRDDDAVLWARTQRFADALRRGDARGLDAELDRCAAIVRETRGRHHDWWLQVLRTCRALHARAPGRGRGAPAGLRGGQPAPLGRPRGRGRAAAARPRDAPLAPARDAARAAARLRRPPPPAAGVGGHGGAGRMGAGRPGRGPPQPRRLPRRRLRGDPPHARRPRLPRHPRRSRRGRGRRAGGARSSSPSWRSTPPSTRASTIPGRPGGRRRAAPACWPRRPASPSARPRTSRPPWSSPWPGARRRGSCARPATGSAAARRCPTARRWGARVLELARDLELPWVARFADARKRGARAR